MLNLEGLTFGWCSDALFFINSCYPAQKDETNKPTSIPNPLIWRVLGTNLPMLDYCFSFPLRIPRWPFEFRPAESSEQSHFSTSTNSLLRGAKTLIESSYEPRLKELPCAKLKHLSRLIERNDFRWFTRHQFTGYKLVTLDTIGRCTPGARL